MRFERSGTTARSKNEAAELYSSLAFLCVSTSYQDEGDLAKIWRDFEILLGLVDPDEISCRLA